MQENICDILEGHLSAARPGKVSKTDLSIVASSFLAFRDIVDYLVKSPKFIFESIFKNDKVNKFYYPCDVVELRNILFSNCISSTYPIALFPLDFSTTFFGTYPVLLVLKDIEASIDLGSMKVIKSTKLDISNCLLSVLVSQSFGSGIVHKVHNIVSESEYDIAVEGFNRVPGMSLHQDKFSAITYVVNIKSLGIDNEKFTADSDVKAVQQALDQRWMGMHGSEKARPKEYKAEYWHNVKPEFWSSIVKEGERGFNLTKKSQQSEIQLTPHESQIFDFLKEVNRQVGIDLRVAGGWTRDKLLGQESDDVDIAISGMSGFDFAKIVENYGRDTEEVGEAYQVSIEKSAKDKRTLNPDLFVGGINLFGQKVEFVPMRTETYQPGSRTPIAARTDDVTDDVVRRDLTINAIYYNINTGQVEDYVNGKEDLQNMYLRTPTDPVKTFTDDPLRILRALRFYSKYGNSTLDPAIIDAINDPAVQKAYHVNEVASERAGPEIMKMMGGEKPDEAVRHLFETGLYKTVFNVPEMEGLNPIQMDQQTPHHKFDLMNHTISVLKNYNDKAVEKGLPTERRILRNLSALFHDFGKMHPEIQTPHPNNPGQMQYLGHEDKSVDIADSIMKSIGIPDKSRKYVNKLVSVHMAPHLHQGDKWTNKSIGKLIRKMNIEGQEELIDDLVEDLWDHGIADELSTDPDKTNIPLKEQHYEQVKDYQRLQREQPVAFEKPLLNGHEIMQMVPELSAGPFISEVTTALNELRDGNPAATKDDAVQVVNDMKPFLLEKYQQQQPPIQAFNLKKVKLAENDFGMGDTGGYEGFHAQEGGEHREPGDMTRPIPAHYPFYQNQTVRKRQGGMLFNDQTKGQVVDITDQHVFVKWDGEEEPEQIENNPISLSGKIQRVN